jgi:hypothetical protein
VFNNFRVVCTQSCEQAMKKKLMKELFAEETALLLYTQLQQKNEKLEVSERSSFLYEEKNKQKKPHKLQKRLIFYLSQNSQMTTTTLPFNITIPLL